MQIREKEGSRQLADIENAMFLAKQKALADSETSVARHVRRVAISLNSLALRYRIETLARANEKLLTKEYLHLQVRERNGFLERFSTAFRFSLCECVHRVAQSRSRAGSPCKPCHKTPKCTSERKSPPRCTSHAHDLVLQRVTMPVCCSYLRSSEAESA